MLKSRIIIIIIACVVVVIMYFFYRKCSKNAELCDKNTKNTLSLEWKIKELENKISKLKEQNIEEEKKFNKKKESKKNSETSEVYTISYCSDVKYKSPERKSNNQTSIKYSEVRDEEVEKLKSQLNMKKTLPRNDSSVLSNGEESSSKQPDVISFNLSKLIDKKDRASNGIDLKKENSEYQQMLESLDKIDILPSNLTKCGSADSFSQEGIIIKKKNAELKMMYESRIGLIDEDILSDMSDKIND